MTITNTYRWNGKHGSDWNADIPNPPGPDLTNWDNISNIGANPSFPQGAGDLAVIDLGGAIDISASHPASAEEIQIVNASTVTFSSGHFDAGADGEVGGMLIDEDATLIIAGSGTMANQGSLDIIGLTGNGSLEIDPGAGFDDLGMIVGADADAHGEVTVNAAFGFIIAQSAPGSTDGVLVVGEDGTGTVDVSDTSIFGSAVAILGKNPGSTGEVDLHSATWAGSSLTIGPAGDGVANVGLGSTVAFTDTLIGPNGLLKVTGDAVAPGDVLAPHLTLSFGTIDVSGGGEVQVGSAPGAVGAVSIAGTSLTALGTIRGDVVAGPAGVVQATGSAPGELLIDGNVHGTGTIEPLMTLEVNGGVDAGVDIAFSASIGAQVGVLVLDVPGAELGTISGFDVGNTIDVQGSVYSTAIFTQGVAPGQPGTLTLSGGASPPLSLTISGDYASDSFTATPTTNDTVVTVVPCFAAGTRIATEAGELAVEELAVGTRVRCLRQGAAPIVWIGRRHLDLRRHPRPRSVWPVLIEQGAFADNVPSRDMWLSPDHAVFAGGVLIPVRHLVNGRTVRRIPVTEVTYYHVELARHDVVFAEALPVESYLDTGDRQNFGDGRAVVLYPDLATRIVEAMACAPLVVSGPELAAVRSRLHERIHSGGGARTVAA